MAIHQVVDTNILVYAYDRRDQAKQRRARDLLAELARAGTAAIPAQALGVFERHAPPAATTGLTGRPDP